jgi:LEA14-like dessication related protein
LKNWIAVALVALGFWVLTKYRAGQSLTFRPRGVSFDGSNIILNLGITNNSSFPISFQSFSGTVSANGIPLGTVQDYIPASIAPNIETTLQFQVAPSLSNIVSLIKNVFSANQSQDIALDGTVMAENVSFPVNTIFQTIPAIA